MIEIKQLVDLTPILEAVIALTCAIVTAFLIPWIKEKLGAEKFSTLQKWVIVAVEAAEKLYQGSGRGDEKKAYVLDFLSSKGFTVDSEKLDALIESAVYGLTEKE